MWPHDDAPETLHAGAFEDGAMIATGTIHREPPPAEHFPCAAAGGANDATSWRLRGMATDPEQRSRGCGAAIVAACLDHARANGGTLVWCTARIRAVPFYERLGFRTHGDVFEAAGIGPHYVMSKSID